MIYRDLFSIDLLRNAWYGMKLALLRSNEPEAFHVIGLTFWTWPIIW